MKKEFEEAKFFSEQLDRLLSGEEIQSEIEMTEDVRQALNFAREIRTARAEPTVQYKDLLKNRLLARIRDQENERVRSKPGWIERLISQPVWRTVTAVLVIAIIGGTIWATGFWRVSAPPVVTQDRNATMSSAEVTPAPTLKAVGSAPPSFGVNTASGLEVSGFTDQQSYINSSNAPVHITVTLTNISGQNLSLQQYPPSLSIRDTSKRLVYSFKPGDIIADLEPEESISYSVIWDQKDLEGNLVPPGTYDLVLGMVDLQEESVDVEFSTAVQIVILPD